MTEVTDRTSLRAALATAVVARRVELGFHTRDAFADESKLSLRTLGDIEKARRDSYDAATLARLDQALGWPPGRAQATLAGTDVRVHAGVAEAQGKAYSPTVLTTGEVDPIVGEIGHLLSADSPISPTERDILRTILDRVIDPYRRQTRQRRSAG